MNEAMKDREGIERAGGEGGTARRTGAGHAARVWKAVR